MSDHTPSDSNRAERVATLADPGREHVVRVGLVGAGLWANDFTAPMIARSEELHLAGVWARRSEPAAELADRHGATSFHDLDNMVEAVDALAFAVPPDVQADIAGRLAPSGHPMLLEKPLARSLDAASTLVERLDEFGVPSAMVFTNRYLEPMTELLDGIEAIEPHGAHATFVGGGAVAGARYATPWRVADGALPDLGPHVLDALSAACGPIDDVRCFGDPHGVLQLICHHASGIATSAALSVTTPGEPSGLSLDVWGASGRRSMTISWSEDRAAPGLFVAAQHNVAHALAALHWTRQSHQLNARHGLHIQQLLDTAETSLATTRV